ncbi:MAG: response regulator transcription factor [Chloroflexota bacterium]
MPTNIRVGILDDHQLVVDGYVSRLKNKPNIFVEATVTYGEELEGMLSQHELDILILDVTVPISPSSDNPYPILHEIPKILRNYPKIAIIVITMHNQKTLIESVMQAGASGFILKDDRKSMLRLGDIISSVASGGIFFSERAYQLLNGKVNQDYRELTERQKEVLSLLASQPNSTTAELAKQLDVAPSTVRNLLSDSYVRLKVNNKTAAIVEARNLGLITPYSEGASIADL